MKNKIFYFIPRILAILYLIFISIFALDTKILSLGFLMHLIPSILILFLIIFAWKNEKRGGVLFIVFAILSIIFFKTYKEFVTFLSISCPLLIIGLFFYFQEYLKKDFKKSIIIILASLLFIVMIAFSCSMFVIYREVKSNCDFAKNEFKKDCVDSLIDVLGSSSYRASQKNGAIWALGQLADPKALPVLKSLYNGNLEEREPVSQYEVQKAIKWCEKGNATNWMYRNIK